MLPGPGTAALAQPKCGYFVISGPIWLQLTHMSHAISKGYTRALCHAEKPYPGNLIRQMAERIFE